MQSSAAVTIIVPVLANLLSALTSFVANRAWDFYPFVPPVFSLLLSWIAIPVYNRWFYRRLRERLKSVPLFPGSEKTLAEKKEQM